MMLEQGEESLKLMISQMDPRKLFKTNLHVQIRNKQSLFELTWSFKMSRQICPCELMLQ